MEQIFKSTQAVIAAIGGIIGAFFGGADGFMIALIVFVATDYITGFMLAIIKKELSSQVGFKGIAKKVCIFALVGIGHLIDSYIIMDGNIFRTAVIFFYLSNEGLSLLENITQMGVPVPNKIKDVLAQIKDNNKD